MIPIPYNLANREGPMRRTTFRMPNGAVGDFQKARDPEDYHPLCCKDLPKENALGKNGFLTIIPQQPRDGKSS